MPKNVVPACVSALRQCFAHLILKELENRYVATVTITSSGVGVSAAIPGVGIPLALGLGAADLLFFYETSALYVLAVTELHGIEVSDVERAQPLVSGVSTKRAPPLLAWPVKRCPMAVVRCSLSSCPIRRSRRLPPCSPAKR